MATNKEAQWRYVMLRTRSSSMCVVNVCLHMELTAVSVEVTLPRIPRYFFIFFQHVDKNSCQNVGGIGTHLPLDLAIRHQAPLCAAIRPSFCIWQFHTHSRCIFICIGNLEGEDWAFHDSDPRWRYRFEFYLDDFRRFIGSKRCPDFGSHLDDSCRCYICTVWKLLGSAYCRCYWCYKSKVRPQLKICMHCRTEPDFGSSQTRRTEEERRMLRSESHC
jgi:hypothetical protein